MAKVYPFRGLRYALSRIPITKVVTQPYDKISKEMQERYYALHPNNIIRVVLGNTTADEGPSNDVYTRAATILKEWRRSGIVERTGLPSFFVYFQHFNAPGTDEVYERKGFIGLAKLEDYADKVVFPHERTLSGPKQDRLELLRHTRTHFEQIFMLYEDAQQNIDRVLDKAALSEPDMQVEDEYGVLHRVWSISDPATIKFIQEQMNDKKLIIADGHHRYETALAYRDEMRAAAGKVNPEAPFEQLTMTFFNMDAPGLTILPTHRVVSNLVDFDADRFFGRASEFFDITSASADIRLLRSQLQKMGETQVTIGVATDSGRRFEFLSLKPSLNLAEVMPDLSEKQRRLDVVVLHRLLLGECLGISEDAVKRESHIKYVREMEAAVNAVKTDAAQVCFLLNPTGLRQMRDIAYEGNVMPQKSTDFYPKVLSGLIMYPLD